MTATREPLRLRMWIALAALAVALACEFLPWAVAGVGNEANSYSGFDIPPLAIAELLAIAASFGLAFGALLFHRPSLMEGALAAAVIAVAITAATIFALETVATMIPDSVLPATLRRGGLDLGAGIGLWLSWGAGLIAVLALTNWRFRPIEIRIWTSGVNRGWALALVSLLALTALFGWLRYQTWFEASAAGEDLGLAGWASPWIGPLSLIAVCMTVAAIGLALVARTLPAGLLAAIGGWLMTLVAALAIVAANTIGGLANLADGALGTATPDFGVTLAAWAAFLVGLGVAAVGAWLVCLRPPTIPG
jgi:hypothetical protein